MPDRPSSISKLLNCLNCDEEGLLEVLEVSYDLTDDSISRGIREQDRLVREVQAMAAGISQKLPRTYNAAMKSKESELWRAACQREIDMLVLMGVWEEVDLPAGKHAVTSTWVFNRKCDANGKVVKYKTRFVVRGFDQREGIDFQGTFAPTARFASLMIMFAICVKRRWHVRGFDVVSAYPHSPIDEELYIEPAEGFLCKSGNRVLRLKKALYKLLGAGGNFPQKSWWEWVAHSARAINHSMCCGISQILQYYGFTWTTARFARRAWRSFHISVQHWKNLLNSYGKSGWIRLLASK